MNNPRLSLLAIAVALALSACQPGPDKDAARINPENLMIRIAEIEVDSAHLKAYLEILREEAAASIKAEPGVISIFPMYETEAPTRIRLVEIYADSAAYRSHLETPHFLKYKNGTLHMVKSLRLVDMQAIDPETMPQIFARLSD